MIQQLRMYNNNNDNNNKAMNSQPGKNVYHGNYNNKGGYIWKVICENNTELISFFIFLFNTYFDLTHIFKDLFRYYSPLCIFWL